MRIWLETDEELAKALPIELDDSPEEPEPRGGGGGGETPPIMGPPVGGAK
jgi:hypothetical protein